ncbi:hypothetical protein [Caudovirales GX15bay]|nr:hypothetical protein [Caudovirales GX15bay]
MSRPTGLPHKRLTTFGAHQLNRLLGVVKDGVVALQHHGEILGPVVALVLVEVMDYLVGLKEPFDLVLHHDPVLKHPAT